MSRTVEPGLGREDAVAFADDLRHAATQRERGAVIEPPRHVLFDLDGTLTDPAPGIVACYQHVLRAMEPVTLETDVTLRRFIGPPLRVTLGELLGTDDPGRIEDAVALYRERFATQGLYENAVYDGVREMLSVLSSAGFQLWIVTSKARVYAEEIARHFEIFRYFRGVYGAELSGERSNKEELIGHLLECEGVVANTAVMLGDRRYDIDGARAHGLTAMGVLWGYGTREELTAAGAHRLVEAVGDIPAAVGVS